MNTTAYDFHGFGYDHQGNVSGVAGDDREEPPNADRSVCSFLASPTCLVAEVVSRGAVSSIALGATDFSRFLVIVSNAGHRPGGG
jgi:hypothetical protein